VKLERTHDPGGDATHLDRDAGAGGCYALCHVEVFMRETREPPGRR
jgi:hypothetical protein